MKSINLKKLLFVLILGVATSCGSSDNEISESNTNTTDPLGPVNPVVVSEELAELRQFVVDGNFPEQMSHFYSEYTYSERSITYRTTSVLGGFIQGTTYSTSTSQFDRYKEKRGDSIYIMHEYGDSFDQIKAELVSMIDYAVSHQKVNNCLWEIKLSDYSRYGIDTCQSMVANPVYKYVDINGISKTEYWLYSYYP